MTLCYERENYTAVTGRVDHNHCGHCKTIGGVDYCDRGGVFKDYANMQCANSKPPYEQITFSEVKVNDK